jgi:hypothetical protein
MSTNDQTLLVLCVLLVGERAVLRLGQRRLFAATTRATRSRSVAYALAAPGTALHEASHRLACLALGVPITGPVRLFWPQRTASGDVILGSVPHARTGPLRQALISVAPLVLVPGMLTLATTALLSPHAIGDLPDALGAVQWWRTALWIYLTLSCAQAVFPSTGDPFGTVGAVGLGLLAGLIAALVFMVSALQGLLEGLAAVDGVLALPAAAALAALLTLGLLRTLTPARL